MIDRRGKNVEIFEDTMDLINGNSRLKSAIKYSLTNQKLYFEADVVEISDEEESACKTVVSAKRSFEAASDYAKAGKKVCVLNFASATNPGGGVTHGSSAQEECLCRCSTLYPCLDEEVMWKNYYLPHRAAANPLYNDDIIYTPGIVVVKSDVSFPERMPEADWYQLDVLTCAAPNLRGIPSNYMNPDAGDISADVNECELYKLHLQRIDKIFRVAVANGAEVLILGAFGCGAFCNSPEIVAKAFCDVQKKYERFFDTIEYAVYCGKYETQNYDVFCKMFNGK